MHMILYKDYLKIICIRNKYLFTRIYRHYINNSPIIRKLVAVEAPDNAESFIHFTHFPLNWCHTSGVQDLTHFDNNKDADR